MGGIRTSLILLIGESWIYSYFFLIGVLRRIRSFRTFYLYDDSQHYGSRKLEWAEGGQYTQYTYMNT